VSYIGWILAFFLVVLALSAFASAFAALALNHALTQLRLSKQAEAADPERDIHALLDRQFAWSKRTFGDGYRPTALLAHIRKELVEIEAAPTDPVEWIDVALLALDGAWRAQGISGTRVAELMVEKMAINRARKWGSVSADKPTEHVRDEA
jgi:hypothetical protein